MSFDEMNKSRKILRDLIHGYINLTDIDILIIDTPHFQRLKDIRQMTAQHVYPAAQHTRFEHSLGVMELTRQAIKHINANGFLSGRPERMNEYMDKTKGNIVDDDLEFNTSLAALLHDVGHCPFSHLGEMQLEEEDEEGNSLKKKYQKYLVAQIKTWKIDDPEQENLLKSIEKDNMAAHEIMSCIVIMKVYYIYFKWMKKHPESINKDIKDKVTKVDFCFIIRCILGIPYKENVTPIILVKNIMIGLINSATLDMDKLDYIMRDAFYTGISVSMIDTKRLFNDMYISKDIELVYTSKAVSVLQTIIEGRDNLYLYVYNHHTVVYTDFIYNYIFRRLHRNAVKCEKPNKDKPCDINTCGYSRAGMIKREVLFSKEAIIKQMVSDSSLRQRLIHLHRELSDKYINDGKKLNVPCNDTDECYKENNRVFTLLKHLFRRELLKPWWKTIYEYKNFLQSRIPDDKIRKELAKRICAKTKKGEGIEAAEFRSQIAKGIIDLSKEFKKENRLEKSLNDGDFFVVERSNRFFNLKSIGDIYVYLKKNERVNLGLNMEEQRTRENEYFANSLTNLLPHKNYADFFDKDNFYIYIRPYEMILSENQPEIEKDKNKKHEFYEKIEILFVEVSSKLAVMPESEFNDYCKEVEQIKKSGNLPKMLENLKKELELKFPKLDKDNISETQ